MKKYNINTKKTFIDKMGNEKTLWNQVGTLIDFGDGRFAVELSMFPDTKFYTFEQKPRDNEINF